MKIDALVDNFSGLVRGGKTPQEAARNLAQFLDNDTVLQVRAEYEKRARLITTFRDPPAIVRPGGEPWYIGPSADDRYWPALRQKLQDKGWDEDPLRRLDDASTRIVSLLAPPGLGEFSTRGLVVGYVQSGKTASFTAVIAKAADVGYKLIIVLSGIHNKLRRQSQERLEAELVELNSGSWIALTSLEEDFRAGRAGNVNAFLSDGNNQRILCVVKKNAAVLRRLCAWLGAANPSVLRACPTLVIDDEADQASINTGSSEARRTAVNRRLLQVLDALPKAAYVGYTATPFANVFIDPTSPKDLYPRDFIVDLPKPDGYFGPERIFGRSPLTPDEPEDGYDGLDMVRIIDDDEVALLKPTGNLDAPTFAPSGTASLEQAVRYFWLCTAARMARGQGGQHSTMLVHTTLYADVHERFRPLMNRYRNRLAKSLGAGATEVLATLKELWDDEREKVPSRLLDETETSFEELLPCLQDVLKRTEIVVENSRSTDGLDYGEDPRIYIVIGGNVLSRGLTLEGLVVSYFVRAANAYDTLLQMGRWFGYRKGYADLPRIWLTNELREDFLMLATVEQEIRNDIRRYEVEALSPTEFGVRVRTHPDLSITSKLKMQAAVPCDVSYGDTRRQTILFNHKDKTWLEKNIQAAQDLLARIQASSCVHDIIGPHHVFRRVAAAEILSFLAKYQFHPESQEVRGDFMRAYIEKQNQVAALGLWNVGIISQGRGNDDNDDVINLGKGLEKVRLLNRARVKAGQDKSYANLKAIMSDADQYLDLPGRMPRSQQEGLLLIYPISKDSVPRRAEGQTVREPLEAVEHLIGVGLVFPKPTFETPSRYMTVDLSGIPREEMEWSEEDEDSETQPEGNGVAQ